MGDGAANGGTKGAVGGQAHPGAGGAAGTRGVAASGGATGTGRATGGVDATANGGQCGGQWSLELTASHADVLLVLERAASMGSRDAACADAGPCSSRWDLVKAALEDLLSDSRDLYWGLEMFPSPDGEGCGLGDRPQIPCAADGWARIPAELRAATVGGGAPLGAAVEAATAYLQSIDSGHAKYILLATDAEAGCLDGSATMTDALRAVGAAYAAGIAVYVLGVGPNENSLDLLAEAGGTAPYYSATEPLPILDPVVDPWVPSCTYRLPEVYVDPSYIGVYMDKQRVSPDETNGWVFDPATSAITFTGSYCDEVLAVHDWPDTLRIDILYACDPPPKGFPP